MNKNKCETIFKILQANNPTPTTELIYHSPFQLLIAVILSAQATDVSVNKATIPLFKKYNTPEKILKLGEAGLINYIKSIGLYRNKAKNVIATCWRLLETFDGKVPESRTDLESLPGVGRKTANVILNTAFGQPTIAVDTHIFRLANRIGLAPGKTVIEVEHNLLTSIPSQYLKNAHHWLILHGRYVCTARNPKCANCCIFQYCEFKQKQQYAKVAV